MSKGDSTPGGLLQLCDQRMFLDWNPERSSCKSTHLLINATEVCCLVSCPDHTSHEDGLGTRLCVAYVTHNH